MSRYQHRYSRPSLATPTYRLLLLADPQGYILYQHRAAVCGFELDVLPLLVHVKGSTGVHHSQAADAQGYIPFQHRAAVCRFKLDVLPLLIRVKRSLLIQQCPVCLVRLIFIYNGFKVAVKTYRVKHKWFH